MTEGAPVLIARDGELADLEQLLLRAGEHGPAEVVVAGAHGSGRSTLLARLVHDHPGARVARGVAWEQDHPLGVLAQLLGTTPPDDVRAAAATVAETCGGTADEPGLLVVDDADVADPPSLQALSSAVRHHRERPFLVVLVATTGAPVPATAGLLDAVRQRVVVPPLDAAGVQALAAAHGPLLHPALAERLRAHTGGLPGPVVALVRELPRDAWADLDVELPAPASVAAQVAATVAALSEPAVRLVEAACVLGPGTAFADAAAAAGLTGPEEALHALDEASGSALVTVNGRGGAAVLAAADPMVAAAVLARMGPSRRVAAHRRAAEVVTDPADRLQHLVAASVLPDPALGDALEDLAAQRAASGAWGSAADLLARSSRLTDDPRTSELRLARAVDALVGSGDIPAAMSLVPRVESLRETPQRNAVLGYLAVVRGRPNEAEALLARAWDLVSTEREPEVAAAICQRRVLHNLSLLRGRELVQWADRALALVPARSPAAVEAAAIRGLGLAATGRAPEALDDYARLAGEVGHGPQSQRVAMAAGWLHGMLDHTDEARSALESALPTDVLGGSTRISLWAHAWLARVHVATGDWAEALQVARAGVDLVDRSGTTLVGPLLWWTLAQVSALRGEWEAADAALQRGNAGVRDYPIMRVPSCLARAQVAEARADYAGVVRALEPLRQPWARPGVDEPGAWPWAAMYANALAILGRLDEAEEHLRPHESLAAERGHRTALARLGYARGRLLGARGDLESARRAFDGSLDLLAETPLRYDRARVNFAFGQTLRRAGKRREADVVIATARELYAGLGATTYVARCDRELKAGGVHVARTPDQPVDALTPQEQAVSDLVARGLSNREVAAELFVSTKTVQYHLTHVYAKLGVRSRTELAALRGSTAGES